LAANDTAIKRPLSPGNSQKAAPDSAVCQNLRNHPSGSICGNRKPDSLGHYDDGRIDPDDVSGGIN
jgi:hypothetical protein